MKAVALAWTATMLAVPMAVSAADLNVLEAYGAPKSGINVEGPGLAKAESNEGDALGIRFTKLLGENIFLSGEYQSASYEGLSESAVDPDLDQFRVGLGYAVGEQYPVYGLLEVIRYDLELGRGEDDKNGYGAHVGTRFDALTKYLTIDARVGYVDLGGAGDGLEYRVGAAINLDRNFSVFAAYQQSRTSNDNDQDVIVSDVLTGLRFRF